MPTSLALALVLWTASDEPATEALIAQLGSPRADERDAASSALEARGRAAIPALRAAGDASHDAEVRLRAGRIATRIEHDILTRPIMVRLDVHDRTLEDAIRSLARDHRFGLSVAPDLPRGALLRKVTLGADEPLPLLTALDRMCAAGGLRLDWYDDGEPILAPRPGEETLMLQAAGIAGPASDSGPFRVKLTQFTFHHQRTRYLERASDAEEQSKDEVLALSMEILAEPRLMFTLNGPPRITEAIDDRGQSFAAGGPPDGGVMPNSFQECALRLAIREAPGRSLKRLRGAFPARVVELDPEPLVIPIAGSQGRSFDATDATLKIETIDLDPVKEWSIHLILHSRVDGVYLPEPGRPPMFAYKLVQDDWSNFVFHQFDVLDEQGRRINASLEEFHVTAPGTALVTLQYFDLGDEEPGIPARLLYHGLLRTMTEIPFDFHDIPLP